MSNTRNGRAAKDGRRNDAAIRQAEREGITDQQQMDKLFKGGHCKCREIQRLRHRIAAAKRGKDDWENSPSFRGPSLKGDTDETNN